MALVTILASPLSPEQKERIGKRVLNALHEEGIVASSVMVRFAPETADVCLEGLFFPAAVAPQVQPMAAPAPAPVQAAPAEAIPEYKTRARRKKSELEDFKRQLVQRLQMVDSLSSFDAQDALGLKDCDWAPGTLRNIFGELVEAGLVRKFGQKRGTRYQWVGLTQVPPQESRKVLVVKATDGAENPTEA